MILLVHHSQGIRVCGHKVILKITWHVYKALKCLSICPPANFMKTMSQHSLLIDALRSIAPQLALLSCKFHMICVIRPTSHFNQFPNKYLHLEYLTDFIMYNSISISLTCCKDFSFNTNYLNYMMTFDIL